MLAIFFFKQKTAYDMRISDWSSDVCSSDLDLPVATAPAPTTGPMARRERFDGPALPLDWMMLRNPAGHCYRLGGGATPHARAGGMSAHGNPSFLGGRPQRRDERRGGTACGSTIR